MVKPRPKATAFYRMEAYEVPRLRGGAHSHCMGNKGSCDGSKDREEKCNLPLLHGECSRISPARGWIEPSTEPSAWTRAIPRVPSKQV
jgi:hypothetical protein